MIAPKFKWWLNVDIDYLKAFFPRLKYVEIKQIACDKITVLWAPVEEHTRGGVRRSAMIEEKGQRFMNTWGYLASTLDPYAPLLTCTFHPDSQHFDTDCLSCQSFDSC